MTSVGPPGKVNEFAHGLKGSVLLPRGFGIHIPAGGVTLGYFSCRRTQQKAFVDCRGSVSWAGRLSWVRNLLLRSSHRTVVSRYVRWPRCPPWTPVSPGV